MSLRKREGNGDGRKALGHAIRFHGKAVEPERMPMVAVVQPAGGARPAMGARGGAG